MTLRFPNGTPTWKLRGHVATSSTRFHMGPPTVPQLSVHIPHSRRHTQINRPSHPLLHGPPLLTCYFSYSLLYLIHSFSYPSLHLHLSAFRSIFVTMSNYDSTKDSAAQKTEEAKQMGQQKAGEAQQATKVRCLAAICLPQPGFWSSHWILIEDR